MQTYKVLREVACAHTTDNATEYTDFFLRQCVCVLCRAEFTNSTNLGTWGCREHPGILRLDRTFSCCGLRTEARSIEEHYTLATTAAQFGCISSDHNESYTPYSKTRALLQFPRKYIGNVLQSLPVEDLSENNTDTWTKFRRYDHSALLRCGKKQRS